MKKYEKSHRPQSTHTEKIEAFRRAIKVMRGAAEKISRPTVAVQAARYVPESGKILLKILKKMSDEEFAALLVPESVVGAAYPPLPARATRPGRSLSWTADRKRIQT